MTRAILAFVIAIGFLAAGTAIAADETYTIKLYQSKKGDKTDHEKTESGKTSIVSTIGGETKKDEKNDSEKQAYTEVILEKKPGDRHATKLSRTYSASEKTTKGETKKASYVGETVLIEKKDGKYEFSVKGKALKESDAPELFKQFNDKKDDEPRNEDFLPDGAVKVGAVWTVAADKSEKMFKSIGEDKMKIDAKKSAIGGKLLKAYKKDGVQYGVLEFTFTLFITEIDYGDGLVGKATAGSKMVLKATIDTCIDGTIEFEDGKMEMSIDITTEIANVGTIAIKGNATGVEKLRVAKK